MKEEIICLGTRIESNDDVSSDPPRCLSYSPALERRMLSSGGSRESRGEKSGLFEGVYKSRLFEGVYKSGLFEGVYKTENPFCVFSKGRRI